MVFFILFFIFGILVLALENLFFALFSLILFYVLAAILCIKLGFLFHGFLILLLYVGALAVLFLFLIMLFDYRNIFRQNINVVFLFFWLIISFFSVHMFFLPNYNTKEEYLDQKIQGFDGDFEAFLRFILRENRFISENFWLENPSYFLERCSQIERLGYFMYSNSENCVLILSIGFLLTLILVTIYSLLKKR
jgi:NADH:ubiquinone oxidoreductase subunit 6 (subunit J)